MTIGAVELLILLAVVVAVPLVAVIVLVRSPRAQVGPITDGPSC
ncbi:MAG: hypothetical protein ACR2JF_17090 [Iamia sp.]